VNLRPGAVAIVTGAARGIGNAITWALCERGLRVFAADRAADELATLADELIRAGHQVEAIPIDVSVEADVAAFAQTVHATTNGVDLLCNNAGVLVPRAPVWAIPDTDLDRLIAVNLKGVLYGMRHFVPHMIERGTGHIVNTASQLGLETVPFAGGYAAVKHAVVALTECLSEELAIVAPEMGVTAFCPGGVVSRLGESLPDGREPHPALALATVREIVRIPAADAAAQLLLAIENNRRYLVTDPVAADRAHTHQLERARALEPDLASLRRQP
jgi:NADP-dependent 3-hydroxy acid dehydrogenase YdfG